MRLAFGDCLFDGECRTLLRDGHPVHVTPKAFQMLELLIERRPQAVSKADLGRWLWPDTFVSDGSLANVVAEVREAIGDDARRPRFIRTLQRFGYAFCGDVEELPAIMVGASRPRRRLVLLGREIALEDGDWLIGRAADCRVCLDSAAVSRHHARLRISGAESTLEDLGSKNGTYLCGQRLSSPVRLEDGDRLSLGGVTIVFRSTRADSSTDRLDLEP
jgi:DNA-binding winged helix-turn-helix (wHTH) protein